VFSAKFELRPKTHLTTDAQVRQAVFSVRFELRPKKHLKTDAHLRQTVFSVRYELRPKKDGGRCITERDRVLCEVRTEAEEPSDDNHN
jgi:hypothetical protein